MANLKGELIAATTDAATAEFEVERNPMTILAAPALGAAEVANIEFSLDGVTWVQARKGGVDVALTVDDNPITVYGPGSYRVNKGATASATAIGKAEF